VAPPVLSGCHGACPVVDQPSIVVCNVILGYFVVRIVKKDSGLVAEDIVISNYIIATKEPDKHAVSIVNKCIIFKCVLIAGCRHADARTVRMLEPVSSRHAVDDGTLVSEREDVNPTVAVVDRNAVSDGHVLGETAYLNAMLNVILGSYVSNLAIGDAFKADSIFPNQ